MAEQTSDIGEQLATIERKPAKERAPDYSRLQATVGEKLGAAETGLKKAEIDVGIAQKEAGTKALREQIGLEEKELEAGRERVRDHDAVADVAARTAREFAEIPDDGVAEEGQRPDGDLEEVFQHGRQARTQRVSVGCIPRN